MQNSRVFFKPASFYLYERQDDCQAQHLAMNKKLKCLTSVTFTRQWPSLHPYIVSQTSVQPSAHTRGHGFLSSPAVDQQSAARDGHRLQRKHLSPVVLLVLDETFAWVFKST